VPAATRGDGVALVTRGRQSAGLATGGAEIWVADQPSRETARPRSGRTTRTPEAAGRILETTSNPPTSSVGSAETTTGSWVHVGATGVACVAG
jgi:hypothetical protein